MQWISTAVASCQVWVKLLENVAFERRREILSSWQAFWHRTHSKSGEYGNPTNLGRLPMFVNLKSFLLSRRPFAKPLLGFVNSKIFEMTLFGIYSEATLPTSCKDAFQRMPQHVLLGILTSAIFYYHFFMYWVIEMWWKETQRAYHKGLSEAMMTSSCVIF